MSETHPIFQKYSGNLRSDKLTVSKIELAFKFLYQKFRRTNPSQSERKKGFKPQRILVSESVYEFENLRDVDFKTMPFFHLMTEFNIDDQQP